MIGASAIVNTKLLPKNYRTPKAHCESAISERQQIIDVHENEIDILDSLETVYIHSIKRTTECTHIILAHMDEMMRILEISCHQSRQPEDARRYWVIQKTYLQDKELTVEEIAEDEMVAARTAYRDIDIACEKLSALLRRRNTLSSSA